MEESLRRELEPALAEAEEKEKGRAPHAYDLVYGRQGGQEEEAEDDGMDVSEGLLVC